MWLLTIATVIAVGQVVSYSCKPRFDLVAASAALLFAMPQLRSAQPGIPSTPTIFDGNRLSSLRFQRAIERIFCVAVGYYWNIALVGLSTFALILHFSWQLRVSFFAFSFWVSKYTFFSTTDTPFATQVRMRRRLSLPRLTMMTEILVVNLFRLPYVLVVL
jgi:hypothetical protein